MAKITSAESRAISEAAELYGSGEVAMTSRLTIEIQGVPYENIEPLRAHLAQAGPRDRAAPAPRSAPWSPARARPASTA